MKLADHEIAIFGAMMFAAGRNDAEGQSAKMLEHLPDEDFRAAKALAAKELPKFKSQMKKLRTKGLQ